MNTSSLLSRRWFRRVIIAGLVLIALMGSGYFGVTWYANSLARTQIAEQIEAAAGGTAEMGSVAVGLDGVTASDIRITSADGNSPWAKLGELRIESPIADLMSSDATFNRLTASDAEITLDLDTEGNLQLEFPEATGKFALPAKQIDVRNAQLTIRQPDRSDFIASGVNLSLMETDDGLVIEGDIKQLADAGWELAGNYDPESGKYQFKANSDRVELDSQLIAKWPLTPPGVLDDIEVNGAVAANLDLQSEDGKTTNYQVALKPLGTKVRLPWLDLGLQLDDGLLDFRDGKLHVDKLNAQLAEGSAVLNGDVDFSGSPIRGSYSAELSDVGDGVIAKLVALPPEVTGNVTGSGSGTVTVEDDFSFSLAIQADATSTNGKYLGFALQEPDIRVNIERLRFDDQVEVEEIRGGVSVNTSVDELAVNEFLDRFGLKPAAESPVVAGNAEAKVRLDIPLATAEQVGTWRLEVDASANELAIAGESLKNVNAELRIVDGALQILPATGQIDNGLGQLSEVAFQGQVPLDEKPLAKFEIQGNSVAVEWLLGIAKDYSCDVDQALKMIDQQYDGDESAVTGKLTVNAKIAFPPAASDDFAQWRIEGDVVDGNLKVDDREISNLESSFLLEKSVLTIEKLQGDLDQGGSISIKGTVPLQATKPADVDVSLTNAPLAWLATIGTDISPELALLLNQGSIDLRESPADLAGDVSVAVRATRAASAGEIGKPWGVTARVNSGQITVKNQVFRDLAAAISLNNEQIRLGRFSFTTPDGGSLQTSGVFPLKETGTVEVKLDWTKLPIESLASLVGAAELNARGAVSGSLHIERNTATGKMPIWNVFGLVSAKDASLYEVPLGSFSAEVATTRDTIGIQNVTLGESGELRLTAQMKTSSPYDFSISTDIRQLDLKKVFHGQKAFASVPKVVGRLSLVGKAEGTLDPLVFVTSGDAQIDQLEIDDRSFDDVLGRWSELGSDPQKGEAFLQIVGGVIELDEWSAKPEKISVAIRNLDAAQLTSVGELPVTLAGRVSGTAMFESWNDPVARHGNISIEGATTRFGPLEVGKLRGDIDLREKRLEYQVVGSVFDGSLIAKGETEIPAEGIAAIHLPINVQLTETNLNRVHTVSSQLTGLRELFGVVSMELDLEAQGPDFMPAGTGRVRVRDLVYKGKQITSGGETDLVLQDGILSSKRFQFDLGGGDISGSIRYPISGNQPGAYEVNLRRVRLAMLDLFDIQLERRDSGWIDARFVGDLGPTVTGSGQLAVSRASAFGLEAESFRLPIQYRINLINMSGVAEIRRTQFSILHGSAYVKGELNWGSRFDFSLEAQLSNIDSRRLVSAISGSEVYDQGKLDGKLVLKGRSVRSLRDLRGSFKGKLERSQALSFPVLSDLATFINAGPLSQSEFDSQDIDLTLANGIVKVNTLSFSNSTTKILINGKVTLEGRLDLNVVALIGDLNSNQAFLALTRLPLTQLSSVGMLLRVTEFLSNRTIYAHIGGTANSPVFRLETGILLRDEAIRFLLRDTEFQQNLQIR